MIWLPDRCRHQRRVVASLYEQAAAVPCERRAVFVGGLRGADKDAALAAAGITPGSYFTISMDRVVGELTRRSLIPSSRAWRPWKALTSCTPRPSTSPSGSPPGR